MDPSIATCHGARYQASRLKNSMPAKSCRSGKNLDKMLPTTVVVNLSYLLERDTWMVLRKRGATRAISEVATKLQNFSVIIALPKRSWNLNGL